MELESNFGPRFKEDVVWHGTRLKKSDGDPAAGRPHVGHVFLVVVLLFFVLRGWGYQQNLWFESEFICFLREWGISEKTPAGEGMNAWTREKR